MTDRLAQHVFARGHELWVKLLRVVIWDENYRVKDGQARFPTNWTSIFDTSFVFFLIFTYRGHLRAGHGRDPVGVQIRHAEPQPERVLAPVRAAGLRGRHQHGRRVQAVTAKWVKINFVFIVWGFFFFSRINFTPRILHNRFSLFIQEVGRREEMLTKFKQLAPMF